MRKTYAATLHPGLDRIRAGNVCRLHDQTRGVLSSHLGQRLLTAGAIDALPCHFFRGIYVLSAFVTIESNVHQLRSSLAVHPTARPCALAMFLEVVATSFRPRYLEFTRRRRRQRRPGLGMTG